MIPRRRVPWYSKLLIAAVVFAGGCLSLTVHMFPVYKADVVGLVVAFLFGASLPGFACWCVVGLWKEHHAVKDLTAEVPRIDVGVVLPLSGVVREPKGKVYGNRRPTPFPVNDGRRTG